MTTKPRRTRTTAQRMATGTGAKPRPPERRAAGERAARRNTRAKRVRPAVRTPDQKPSTNRTARQRARLGHVKRIKALQRKGLNATEIQRAHPEFGTQPTIAKAMAYPLWYFERTADDPDRIDCIPGDTITDRPRTNEEWMMLIEGILGGTKTRGVWTWDEPWPFPDGTLTRLIRYAERKHLKAWVRIYESYGDVRPSANGGW